MGENAKQTSEVFRDPGGLSVLLYASVRADLDGLIVGLTATVVFPVPPLPLATVTITASTPPTPGRPAPGQA